MTDKKDAEKYLEQLLQKDNILLSSRLKESVISSIQNSSLPLTPANEEPFKRLIKAFKDKSISQAPPPIRPVSGLGLVRTSTNKPQEKQEVFIPVDGVELMHQWAVNWKCLFDLARQGVLIPDEPKHIQNCIDCDFGMLSNYPPDEIDEYFSQWLYNPQTIEKFEAEHPDIIEAWQKKVKTSDDKEQKQDATETELAPQTIPLVNAEEFIQSSDDADTFIRSLRIYYVNDQEIKIGTGGKPKVYTRKALGFEKASSAWGELLKILNSSNHLYYTGKAHGAYRQRKTTYDASQKTLRFINDKIVSFLNNAYPIQLSKGFKIYEHPVSERPGMYKFKFQIINNAEEEQTAEYDQCSQSELLTIIEDLSLNHGDKNSLKLAVSIAQEKNWLGEHRAKSYLNGTIEK